MAAPLNPRSIRYLQGFGGVDGGAAYSIQVRTDSEVEEAFNLGRKTGRKIVVRGAGRSYGDPAFNPESIALDLSLMNSIEDLGNGLFRLEAGATLETLWQFALPRGYWLPVVSGTAKPTLGGALAANIHGKNAFKAGTLGEHVAELGVVFPSGESRVLTPEDELFWAVVGGMGLVGVITWAKLRMHPVSSGFLTVHSEAIRDWSGQFRAFEAHESEADYMVSWVDMCARGRGLFHWASYADHLAPRTPRSQSRTSQLTDANGSVREPPSSLEGESDAQAKPPARSPATRLPDILRLFNNRLGIRLINWVKATEGRLRHHDKTFQQSLSEFQFLLDKLPGWERMYAPNGFYQVQVFVPASTAPKVFPRIEAVCHRHSQEPNLAVMKLHKPAPHLLSYCNDRSYSLAMDFRNAGTGTLQIAQEIYEEALAHEGRIYLAKDQVLSADQFRRVVGEPALQKFLALRAEFDPEGLLESAQAQRLGIVRKDQGAPSANWATEHRP